MLDKQQQGFPVVAVLRKGRPKKKVEKTYSGQKKTIEVMGEDLNQKMRLHFQPGTDTARAAFHTNHAADLVKYPANYTIPEGYEFTKINAVVPCASVWAAWDYGNEVYQAGRRLGLADDAHWLYLKDPLDGNKFLVKDGEPYRKFEPKEVISYERDGKKYDLAVKTHGRLRLVLTDMMAMGQLVQVELKTTSYYDCLNINSQLAGIQAIADIVNGGNAGGVIFSVYRSQQNVTWNKPDGGAMRVDKWFFNIQADPEWVKKAFARMSAHALTGEALAKTLLPAPETIEGPVDPNSEELDPEGEFVPPEAGEVFDSAPVEIHTSASDILGFAAAELQAELDGQQPPEPTQPAQKRPEPPAGKPDKIAWSMAQKDALVLAHLAKDDFGAKGMLGLSNLPASASPELIVEWGKQYRAVRPLGATNADPSTKAAAEKANAWYSAYAKTI